MPDLPVSDGKGQFKALAIAELWAVMWAPWGGEDLQQAWQDHTAHAFRSAASHFKEIPADTAVLDILINARDFDPADTEEIPQGALVATVILYLNLACSRHHPELVGVQRAGYALPWAMSRSAALRHWTKYRTASHLWLAQFVRRARPWEEDTATFLRDFLSCSEFFRKAGEEIFPHSRKTPLLPPGETWKAPDDLGVRPRPVELDPLAPELVDRLRSYKAPKSSY